MKSNFKNWLGITALLLAVSIADAQVEGGSNPGTVHSTSASDVPGSSKRASISKNDERNIKTRAQNVVSRFMNLLNTIATGLDLEMVETEEIMRKSYLPVESKIFLDSAVIVEDDLRKIEDLSQVKQKTIYSYLRDFEIFYKKSDSASVFFRNFAISNVKQGAYLYIKVSYECLFGNKSKISDDPYAPQKRVAELKVEKLNNKWKAWVIDVHFEDSLDRADAGKNDVAIVEDQNIVADSLSGESENESFIIQGSQTAVDPAERERVRKKNDSLRTYIAFRNLIDSGKHSLNRGQFIIAYQFFNEAEMVTNGSAGVIGGGDREFLQTMIKETKRNIDLTHRTPEEMYQSFMQEALLRKNQHRYEEAVDYYSRALELKPSDETARLKKHQLTATIANQVRIDAKFWAGKYKDAINEYDKAIAADPANSDYYLGRGKCFEKTKDWKKAMNDFRKATELDENNLEAYKLKAALHEKQNAFPEAIAAYTVCSTIDKADITSFLKIAELNLANGNANAALAALDRGIASNPQSGALYLKKGETFYQLKQARQAADNLSIAIQYDSVNALIYFERAISYTDQGRYESAAADFASARRLGLQANLDKQSFAIAESLFTLGVSEARSGKIESALNNLTNAILISPANALYRYQRGSMNYSLERWPEAIRDLTDALAIDPAYFDACQLRGLAKLRSAQYRDAINDFEKASRINPKSAETFKYSGDAYLLLKDYPKAISTYDQALDAAKSKKFALTDSLEADLHNGKGLAYLNSGNFKEALQSLNQSLKLDHSFSKVFFNRSVAYLKLNELENAEEDIQKALGRHPGNPLWNATLGDIYFQKGKYDKAIFQYTKAISADTLRSLFPDPYYQRARSYVKVSDFQAALNDCDAIRSGRSEKKYSDFYTTLGHVFLYVDQADSARICFERENKTGLNPMALYGMALVYVQKNQPDQAFLWLDRSAAAGKIPKATITSDRRLDPIRGDKRFKKFMKSNY